MSKIQVDAIEQQTACGTTLTAGGGAGKTVVVDATTVTLGRCGGTVALASGASQTGFGRTGTVDWQTGSIKTGTFTAANGEGYFANTAGGTFTMNLPAGVVGAIVSVQDYNNTFDSNALTVDANGTEKINGGDGGQPVELSTEGRGVTFVYVDATVGWRSVQDNDFTKKGLSATFICASVSGACNTLSTVDTNFKVATFTGPGTFTVNSVGCAAGSNEISYMVVAGGGGGGATIPGSSDAGGAGGAGGYREGKTPQCTYTASPIACTSGSNNGLSVTATGYPVTIGGGGTGGPINCSGTPGSNTIFAGSTTITSTGGGEGKRNDGPVGGNRQGTPGGSGGGPSGGGSGMSGGNGNTPPVSPSQGFPGSSHNSSPDAYGGAGGGAGGAGQDSPNGNPASQGGAATSTSINGSSTTFSGGGGGGGSPAGPGGQGGGQPSTPLRGGGGPGGNAGGGGNPGTANTGGGGGGGGGNSGPAGGNGGTGIVMIRYKFQ